MAFVLVLTGQSMAIARGAAPATDRMVLCVGTTSQTVYIDENGTPTQAPHFCPDCTLNVMVALVPDVYRIGQNLGAPEPEQIQISAAKFQQNTRSYLSRAPPLLS